MTRLDELLRRLLDELFLTGLYVVGYRPDRFHNAIYFHLADLNLYPDSLQSTHTKA